jgi:hypothetical protein
MTPDFFLNSLAQLIAALICMVIIYLVVREFRPYAVELLLVFEVLLVPFILKRLDELANHFGVDFLPTALERYMMWVVIGVIGLSMYQIHRKRAEIHFITDALARQNSEAARLAREHAEAARLAQLQTQEQARLNAEAERIRKEQAARLAQFELKMRPFELRMWNGSDALAADRARSLNTEIETANALNAPDVTPGGAQVVYKVDLHG